jgi:hypothetical protein
MDIDMLRIILMSSRMIKTISIYGIGLKIIYEEEEK